MDLSLYPGLIEKALRIATVSHQKQKRKGEDLPYIIHPYMVAMKLMQHGFSEAVVAAALTHDVLEDTDFPEQQLREELGEEVYNLVKTVSHDSSLPWEEKKKKYIETVRAGSEGAKAICLADKIHNLESLFIVYKNVGPEVWKSFHRGKEKKLWFETAVLDMLRETWQHPLIDEYARLIELEKQLE
jgi:(p)ppGpp synthase/HD superfamily hydrolase